jgi:hypothetical protein
MSRDTFAGVKGFPMARLGGGRVSSCRPHSSKGTKTILWAAAQILGGLACADPRRNLEARRIPAVAPLSRRRERNDQVVRGTGPRSQTRHRKLSARATGSHETSAPTAPDGTPGSSLTVNCGVLLASRTGALFTKSNEVPAAGMWPPAWTTFSVRAGVAISRTRKFPARNRAHRDRLRALRVVKKTHRRCILRSRR